MSGNPTLNLLHQELDKINLQKLEVKSLYFLDEKTGEFTEIAEVIPESSQEIIDNLRKRHQNKTKYALLYQKSIEILCDILSPSELRVLMYMVSTMKYENAIYDMTYRGVSKQLGMGLKTVSNVVNSLIDHNLVFRVGTSQKKIYYINPVVVWKGAWHRQKYRLSMFKENENDLFDENEKK